MICCKKRGYLNNFETDFDIDIRLIASAKRVATLIIRNLDDLPILKSFEIEFEITNFLIFDLFIFFTA